MIVPPYRAVVAPGAGFLTDIDLNPLDPQPAENATRFPGNVRAIRCNAIAVNLRSTSEFERALDDRAEARTLELVTAACEAVDGMLGRLRVLTRATHIRPLDPNKVTYRVVFLDDEGTVVPSEEGKFKATTTVHVPLQHASITSGIWQAIADLGAYDVPSWDELVLDAQDEAIEVGPTVVLAAAAIETRIATALTTLASAKDLESFWEWLSTRDHYTKEPSVAEKLDVLLREFGGRSLKEDGRLWEYSVNLRTARNTFVHEGRAKYGRKDRRRVVTRELANEFAHAAGEIIDFIEALLPPDERRPRTEAANFKIVREMPLGYVAITDDDLATALKEVPTDDDPETEAEKPIR